jgi:hypothetical protein
MLWVRPASYYMALPYSLLQFYHHPVYYFSTILLNLSLSSLSFSKLFIYSLWPSLIRFKSNFSPLQI